MDAFLNFLARLLSMAIPPTTADPTAQYLHRLRTALVACSAFMGLLTFISMSFGWIPGFDGFARTSDLKIITKHVIGSELLTLRYRSCSSTNEDAKRLYAEKVNALMDEYQRTTGMEFNLPACSDL